MFSILPAVAAVFMMVVSAQAQNTTMMMVDNNDTMANGPTTPMMMMTTTSMMAGDDNDTTTNPPMDTGVTGVTDSITTETAGQPDTTMAPVDPVTTTAYVDTTTPAVVCNNSIGRLDEIYAFTNTDDFTNMLSQNEQILVYEVLAAAEGCKMSSFINAETAERIFRMLGSLPVRHVYIFLHYMAMALEYEGVVIPQ